MNTLTLEELFVHYWNLKLVYLFSLAMLFFIFVKFLISDQLFFYNYIFVAQSDMYHLPSEIFYVIIQQAKTINIYSQAKTTNICL